jgi:hypothetical protein
MEAIARHRSDAQVQIYLCRGEKFHDVLLSLPD